MSAYDNVVVGKLKLKGKALDVKAGGIKKKKKRDKSHCQLSVMNQGDHSTPSEFLNSDAIELKLNIKLERAQINPGGNTLSTGLNEVGMNEADKDGSNGQGATYGDILTPAEKRFLQQTEKLELQRLVKMASKSHRDRIQEFNRYLANLSEHYDIPKVGPG